MSLHFTRRFDDSHVVDSESSRDASERISRNAETALRSTFRVLVKGDVMYVSAQRNRSRMHAVQYR